MRFGELVEGRFIRRLNRFAALVDIDSVERTVHVANSGRMRELLEEGRRVFLKPVPGDHRKTAFDLALVDLGHTLVSADARLPNALVCEVLEAKRLPQFAGYDHFTREVTYGESRLDIALEGSEGMCYVETKSVTLIEGGTGLFPDSPTIRGKKHVDSLSKAILEGYRAVVFFVVQRDDAQAFSPNDAADPQFGVALRRALSQGVEVYAYGCRVTTGEIALSDPLTVKL
ncbi:MAG: DNA/RNA nuclease SfsA [Dehalococcoidia bacterium]|nr:DNA/RNA nuclease SfsA [Dehalococcoidia bacterium]